MMEFDARMLQQIFESKAKNKEIYIDLIRHIKNVDDKKSNLIKKTDN